MFNFASNYKIMCNSPCMEINFINNFHYEKKIVHAFCLAVFCYASSIGSGDYFLSYR